ncbi:MAG: response regulator transcription factor [Epsilonproteobacteria bacterium]|nr:response regulator transcription factor [Campylobacterota bacterium]
MENLKNLKILYIEDEEIIRHNAVEYLSFFCENVYEAEDGLQGYQMYQKHKPDIIICDIMMPRLNGLELIEKIRTKDQKTQVIIATARIDTAFLLKAAELRLVKYLTKPITESKLHSAINDAIKFLTQDHSNILDLNEQYRYDLLNKNLFKEEVLISLNKKESLFLELCAKNHQRTITYSELENYVWEGYMTEQALRSIVKDLRKKLPKDCLKNISGMGYRLQVVK